MRINLPVEANIWAKFCNRAKENDLSGEDYLGLLVSEAVVNLVKNNHQVKTAKDNRVTEEKASEQESTEIEDSVLAFLKSSFHIEGDSEEYSPFVALNWPIGATALYGQFCKASKISVSQQKFGRIVETLGIQKKRQSNGNQYYLQPKTPTLVDVRTGQS